MAHKLTQNNAQPFSPHLKHIDSFQKLQVLLFLQQHADFVGTCRDFADKLFFSDDLRFQAIFKELNRVGFLETDDNQYRLHEDPRVALFVNNLAQVYEDPLDRQLILDTIL